VKKFDELLIQLKAKRTDLSKADSFTAITEIWREIKALHEECAKILDEISLKMANIKDENIGALPENLTFAEAMKRMEELNKTVNDVAIDDLPNIIEEMNLLKNFCFEKLNQEVKIEEVK
jgi:hypothetical protein